MTTLLVGFDSAWTVTNSGALVGGLHLDDGTFQELGVPQIVDYREAEGVILKWQAELAPRATIIMLDQPTIVRNPKGQRPVENIVGSSVSLRYGGMQPASTVRQDVFGTDAPVWPFLNRFGGPADPLEPIAETWVFETYPVLTIIALGWTLPDSRAAGRLPKYNPNAKKDVFDLGLATCLRAGIRRVPRARIQRHRSVDQRRCPEPFAAQELSGRTGCLLVSAGRTLLG